MLHQRHLISTYPSTGSDHLIFDLSDLPSCLVAIDHARGLSGTCLGGLLLLRARLLLFSFAVGDDDVVCVVYLVIDLTRVEHCCSVVDWDVGRRLVQPLRNADRLACV